VPIAKRGWRLVNRTHTRTSFSGSFDYHIKRRSATSIVIVVDGSPNLQVAT
jgi:hypothetical protein